MNRLARTRLALATPFLLAGLASAQQVKLNGPLARPVGGDIFSFTLSADGQFLVYTADQDQDDVVELYARSRSGGAPVKLNGPLVAGGDVLSSFEPLIATALGRVVYLADAEVDGQYELYSVPLTGGTPIKLNAPLASGADVLGDSLPPDAPYLRLSPDQTHVVFAVLAYYPTGDLELYSVPTAGGAPVRLDRPITSTLGYEISSDSRYVVLDESLGSRTAIVRVPLAGGTRVQLTPDVSGAWEIGRSFRIDPSATRVLFSARLGSATAAELYSVPLDASAPATLLTPGRGPGELFPSSDGVWVVLRYSDELIAVRADGSEAPRVLATLPPARRLGYVMITPASDAVLFRSDLAVQGDFEFLRVPIDGSTGAVSLTPGNVQETYVDEPELSPDGSRLLYLGSEPTPGLYTVPVDGSSSPVFVASITRWVGSYDFALDGTYIAFHANQDNDDELELFSVPTFGGTPVQLNAPLPFGGDVLQFSGSGRNTRISADGTHVVYLADGRLDEVNELFVVRADGAQPSQRLSSELATGPVLGDVHEYSVTADGTRAVYLARQEGSAALELYSVALSAREAPVRLNVELAPGRSVAQFALAPDGSRVTYRVEYQQFVTPDEIFSVSTDGGPSTRIATRPGAYPSTLFVSPDGLRIVFSGSTGNGSMDALFSAPMDGSAPGVQLTPFLAALDIPTLVAGTRLVYLAGPSSSSTRRLYSVPLDGSLPPVELSGPLVNGGTVSAFAPTEDETRIVYSASETTRERYDLFVVPVDGSASRTVLAQARIRQASIATFETSGENAVFLADLEERGRRDLYRVPLDGSQTPERLNPPLSHPREVRDFRIAPGGERVVYRADQEVSGHFELYSVPVAGGTPLELSGPRVAGDVGGGSLYEDDLVEPFVIAPDGARVLFRSDLGSGTVGLFSTPIDGSALPIPLVRTARGDVVLSGVRFAPHGSVLGRAALASGETFLFRARADEARSARPISGFGRWILGQPGLDFSVLPGGDRIVYRHDQESDGVVELFLGFLPRGREHAAQR